MAHITHVYSENAEAIYVDGKLFAASEGAIPSGVLLHLLVEQKLQVSSIEFHHEVVIEKDFFPDDVASLVTMLKDNK